MILSFELSKRTSDQCHVPFIIKAIVAAHVHKNSCGTVGQGVKSASTEPQLIVRFCGMNYERKRPMSEEKVKKGRAQRQYPIDFVSPLQLEECLYRLEHDAPEWWEISVIPAENVINFIIWKRDSADSPKIMSHIRGILRRWQGTATRVEGKIIFETHVSSEWEFLGTLLIGTSLLIIIINIYPIGDVTRMVSSVCCNGTLLLGMLMASWLVTYQIFFNLPRTIASYRRCWESVRELRALLGEAGP